MKKYLLQTGSLLLLLIFLVIQALPALHHHTESVQTSQTSVKATSNDIIDNHAGDCLICNFIAHKQVDLPIGFKAVSISIPDTKPVKRNADHNQQFLEAAVHTWTNKGPPTA